MIRCCNCKYLNNYFIHVGLHILVTKQSKITFDLSANNKTSFLEFVCACVCAVLGLFTSSNMVYFGRLKAVAIG